MKQRIKVAEMHPTSQLRQNISIAAKFIDYFLEPFMYLLAGLVQFLFKLVKRDLHGFVVIFLAVYPLPMPPKEL